MSDDMLSLEEAADLLGLSVATMRWYRACFTGPKSWKAGRRVRYWKRDCLEWLEAQEAASSRGGVH